MGNDRVRIAVGVAGVVLLALGLLTESWWTADALVVQIQIGLRSLSACTGDVCQSSALPAGASKLFRLSAGLTYFIGLAGAALVAVGIVLRETHDVEGLARWGGRLCASLVPLIVITIVTFEGHDATSHSWGPLATFVGAMIGAIGGLRGESSSSWEGRTYVPVRAPERVSDEALAAAHGGAAPRPATAPAVETADVAAQRHALNRRVAEAQRSAPPSRSRSGRRLRPGASSAASAAADAARDALRFVARSIEIGPVGMQVIMDSGEQRELLWAEIETFYFRRLPPDPPFEKMLILDIVPIAGPAAAPSSGPVRILPSTRVNYDALPRPATTARENMRQLVAYALSRGAGEVAADSRAFVTDGRLPPLLQAASQLATHDASIAR